MHKQVFELGAAMDGRNGRETGFGIGDAGMNLETESRDFAWSESQLHYELCRLAAFKRQKKAPLSLA